MEHNWTQIDERSFALCIPRNLRHRITAALALLFLTIGAVAAVGQSSATGQIEYLEGDVELNGSFADIGTEVAVGDIIRTGSDGFAEIVFNRRNIFRIGADTRATLRLNAAQPGIDLDRGSVTAVFERLQRIGGNNPSFEIRTPTAVGGVRGTSFFVKVETPTSTYVCACNGKLQVPLQGTTSLNITGTHHRAYRFVKNDRGESDVSTAALEHHGDEDLDSLAEKINHEIPWSD
ncbi:MAG: hypothetical protein GVY29_09240 [Spirochaetes bacterium]|jgi:hypothetical protein|nr:hypothetical protein [Spirochaetota bacterium]